MHILSYIGEKWEPDTSQYVDIVVKQQFILLFTMSAD